MRTQGAAPTPSSVEELPPVNQHPHSVARALAWLTGSSLAQAISGFVLTILLRGILGPARVGVWNLVSVWTSQLVSITLGVHWFADREMPMLRAQGRTREEDEIRGITFTYLLAEAGVLALGFWAYWFVRRPDWGSDLALGLGLVPLLATLNTVSFAYQVFLRNKKAFKVFAWTNAVGSALDWTLVGFVLVGGLRLLLIGLVITGVARAVAYVVVVRRLQIFRTRLIFNRKLLRPMLGFGIPLSIWNLGASLMLRLDSLVVGTALGTTALGLYYLGPQIAASLGSLPTALSVISYPNMMENYGRKGVAGLEPHLRVYTSATMLVLAPVTAALGVFGIDVLVNSFLPAFRPGLPAMKTAVLVIIFLQPGMILVQTLLAMKRVSILIAVTFGALLVQGAVLGAGALSGLTALWAAASSVAGQAAFLVLAIFVCCRLLGIGRAEVLGFWARLPVAGLVFLALALAFDAIPPHPTSFVPAAAVTLGKLGAFSLATLVVALAVDRRVLTETRLLLRGSGQVGTLSQ